MDRHPGKTCFAYALLFIFALMLILTVQPFGHGAAPVSADLFWMPFTPQQEPAGTAMSAQTSSGQASFSLQTAAAISPLRLGLSSVPDFSQLGGRLSGLLTLSAVEKTAVPVLARYGGGRAPPIRGQRVEDRGQTRSVRE